MVNDGETRRQDISSCQIIRCKLSMRGFLDGLVEDDLGNNRERGTLIADVENDYYMPRRSPLAE